MYTFEYALVYLFRIVPHKSRHLLVTPLAKYLVKNHLATVAAARLL